MVVVWFFYVGYCRQTCCVSAGGFTSHLGTKVPEGIVTSGGGWFFSVGYCHQTCCVAAGGFTLPLGTKIPEGIAVVVWVFSVGYCCNCSVMKGLCV